jgi:S1-C subfamily serine protease
VKITSIISLKFILLLLVSCTSSETEAANESLVENDKEYFQVAGEIADSEQKGSVFQIKGLGCNSLQYGTGFFVEENIIVTNAHVVAGVNSPRIIHNGDEHDLAFISLDPNSDLAILRSENFSSKPLRLDEAEEGEFGTILAFVKDGNKVITEVKIREKILAVGKDIFGQPGKSREALSLEARIESGFSGAPVLNEDSAVVGVVFSRSRGGSSTAYAVQSSEVKKILRKEPDLRSSTNCIP